MTGIHACQNCDWHGPEIHLCNPFPDIPNLTERVAPGETMPTGECPVCGALTHLKREIPDETKLPTIALIGTLSDGYEAVGPFLNFDEAVEYVSEGGDLGEWIMTLKRPEGTEAPGLLPDGGPTDYLLSGEQNSVWIGVPDTHNEDGAGISVYIRPTDEGVVVDLYAKGAETQNPIGSTYARFDEANDVAEEDEKGAA